MNLSFKSLFFILALSAIVLLSSLIISTSNLLYIALYTGLIFGLFIFNQTNLIIFIVLIFGLFVVGEIPLFAVGAANKVVWLVSGLGFILFSHAILDFFRGKYDFKQLPTFTKLLWIFIFYALINSIFNSPGTGELVSAFKRYFQMVGLALVCYKLLQNEKLISNGKRIIFLAALVQLPFALFELIKYVPLRESLKFSSPGLIPIDVVAGTFGSTLYGGGANAEMAAFLIIMAGFISIGCYFKKYSYRYLLLLPFILAPLFLGETKIVVILLPIAGFVLFRRQFIKKPVAGISIFIATIFLTYSANLVYLNMLDKTFEDQVRDTIEYNLEDRGYGLNYLNRTTVLSFWLSNNGLENPHRFLFGHGIGASHDATSGAVSRQFPGYGIGLTAISTLLWDLGVIGTILFLSVIIFAFLGLSRIYNARDVNDNVKADIQGLEVFLIVIVVYLFYKVSILESLPFQIVVYSFFSYIAYLEKKYG